MATIHSVHPLSASSKQWTPPDEDLDQRRAHRFNVKSHSSPALQLAPPIQLSRPLQRYPDEEKGRSLRSFSGSLNLQLLSGGGLQEGAGGDPDMTLTNDADDDDDTDAMFADAALDAMGASSLKGWHTLLDTVGHPVVPAPAPTRADWRSTLADAIENANGKLDMR